MTLEENLISISKMPDKERAEFARLANYLMSSTYLLRDNERHMVSNDYLFVERRFEIFDDYFSMIGWRIYKDKQYGVIRTENVDGMNKLKLDKLTTVIILAIRIIYEEKRIQASTSNDVCATVAEIVGKVVNDFSIYKKKPTQLELKDTFRILEKHNLIYRLDESYTDYECRIVILPSILFAVSNEKCRGICEMLALEKENSNEESE